MLEEAEFYNITELINIVKERILQRDKKLCSDPVKKHTYRVLQCHEDELTWMISTMSDEWKFEQVLLFIFYMYYIKSVCVAPTCLYLGWGVPCCLGHYKF